MENKWNRLAAPHIRSKETTATIMKDVMIALAPAALFGIYRFGFRAFLILLLSVTSCVLSEYAYKKIGKIQSGGYECSAMVTGLLLGMNLSPEVPYWMPVAGGVFAIVVVKMLFGGLGRNLLNPALTAKCMLLLVTGNFLIKTESDAVAEMFEVLTFEWTDLRETFFGFGYETLSGTIGGNSTFLLVLGGLYLVLCRVISLRIPVAFLASFTLVLGLCGDYGFRPEYLGMQMCSGGLLLIVFFMATDYGTSPMTPIGKVLFGLLVGALAGWFRVVGLSVAGDACAVLIGNLLVPVLEKMTFPKSFGKGKKANV